MLSGTKSLPDRQAGASGGERNFENMNWANIAEARTPYSIGNNVQEQTSIYENSDNERINDLREQIAIFPDQNTFENQTDDSDADKTDHVFAVKEQKIEDVRNVLGEESHFANLIKN